MCLCTHLSHKLVPHASCQSVLCAHLSLHHYTVASLTWSSHNHTINFIPSSSRFANSHPDFAYSRTSHHPSLNINIAQAWCNGKCSWIKLVRRCRIVSTRQMGKYCVILIYIISMDFTHQSKWIDFALRNAARMRDLLFARYSSRCYVIWTQLRFAIIMCHTSAEHGKHMALEICRWILLHRSDRWSQRHEI